MEAKTVDLDLIIDVNELKAMAYDQLVQNQQGERNLQAINTRIAQLSVPTKDPKTPPIGLKKP